MANYERLFLTNHHRWDRSEEHTSELQSPQNLVCRLLLEKNNRKQHRVRLTARPLRGAAARTHSASADAPVHHHRLGRSRLVPLSLFFTVFFFFLKNGAPPEPSPFPPPPLFHS